MIFGFAILILGVIVQMFTYVLGLLQWNFPTAIVSALQTAISVLSILGGFLPFISTIIAILLILLPAHIIRYCFSVLMWLWSLIPFIGSKTELPSMATLDLRKHPMGKNTIDLRKKNTKGRKTVSDITRG